MEEKKNLNILLETLSCKHLAGPVPSDCLIDKVTSDSRDATGNALFIALAGDKCDGHVFIASAIEKGCAAVILEEDKCDWKQFQPGGTTVIAVADTRKVYAEVVAAFYDHPQNDLKFIGITGTNGKTTISYLLEKVLEDRGERIGVIGTVNYRFTDRFGKKKILAAPFTTPDPVILQRQLRQMADEGVETVIMEVSSHALVQNRLGNIQFDVAAFTNLTHDHLDYHASLEEYFAAKSMLFLQHLKDGGTSVITFQEGGDALENRWSAALAILLGEKNIPFLACGPRKDAAIQASHVKIEIDRTEMLLLVNREEIALVSPLVGRYNVDNILTTLTITQALGHDVKGAALSLRTAAGAPGRLERIGLDEEERAKAVIFVDYAHTPDALENVLRTLNLLPHERLFCVFGCGGDRDRKKRPQMGRIAAALADIAIVTEDNPRSEASSAILDQIVGGIVATGHAEKAEEQLMTGDLTPGFLVIPDRQSAIQRAVRSAELHDIVVIAGKGHEKYQLTNSGRRFFDDCLEARQALLSWDVYSLSKALGCSPLNWSGHKSFDGIATDSRQLKMGEVFVTLKGDTFDGHDYLEKAIGAGAAAVILSDSSKLTESTIPVFCVADTERALGELAAYHRRRMAKLSAPVVIGITGSCGKTTVKEMIAAIFEKRWPDGVDAPTQRVLKTKANFNNLIGLPLSLLPLQLKHRVAVLEMGMNKPGEIARLAEIANPDISCIVNIHGAHLQGLGSIEGVARAKEELFAAAGPSASLVVNLDDKYVSAAAQKYTQKKIFFSLDEKKRDASDVNAADIEIQKNGNIGFVLTIGRDSSPVNLAVPGMHNVSNSLAAAAIAHAAGTDLVTIVKGLESFEAAEKRLQIMRSLAGYSIINDTYNANPASMAAGLATLTSLQGRRKIAVLGDMLELGDASPHEHRVLGERAASAGIGYLGLYGSFAEYTRDGAVSTGMDDNHVLIFAAKDDIYTWIHDLEEQGYFTEDAWLFVKGSRGMRLETLVDRLTGR